jgi:hypothetical protein
LTEPLGLFRGRAGWAHPLSAGQGKREETRGPRAFWAAKAPADDRCSNVPVVVGTRGVFAAGMSRGPVIVCDATFASAAA